MWFYKFETDSKNQLQITWNTSITYFKNIVGFLGLFACLINNFIIAATMLGLLIILLTYYLYKYGDMVKILRIYEKEDKLIYTGSRYSFKDPLKIYCPKIGV